MHKVSNFVANDSGERYRLVRSLNMAYSYPLRGAVSRAALQETSRLRYHRYIARVVEERTGNRVWTDQGCAAVGSGRKSMIGSFRGLRNKMTGMSRPVFGADDGGTREGKPM